MELESTHTYLSAQEIDISYEQGYKDGINFILGIVKNDKGAA